MLTVVLPLVYLFGFGGGDDVGLLATGCCDLSINTLELEFCGLGAGALAMFLPLWLGWWGRSRRSGAGLL